MIGGWPGWAALVTALLFVGGVYAQGVDWSEYFPRDPLAHPEYRVKRENVQPSPDAAGVKNTASGKRNSEAATSAASQEPPSPDGASRGRKIRSPAHGAKGTGRESVRKAKRRGS